MNLSEALGVRYVKLHFVLEMIEDGSLPVSKESAIRGGIGEMLLRANCLKDDRNCEVCEFEAECMVQRTMYSKFDMKPAFMTSGDSVGYVIECEDYRKYFCAGDRLRCNLLLFGKNIAYMIQYVQAMMELGENGLGAGHVRFRVKEIRTNKKQVLYDGTKLDRSACQFETILDYVNQRSVQLNESTLQNVITFHTPLTQKYQHCFLQEFQMEAITKSIQRRLYILNCFEGVDIEEFYRSEFQVPEIKAQEVKEVKVKRYSNRQQSSMFLKGIKGRIELEPVSEELLPLLLAGELIHIGKNTSFGFGRYTIQ